MTTFAITYTDGLKDGHKEVVIVKFEMIDGRATLVRVDTGAPVTQTKESK